MNGLHPWLDGGERSSANLAILAEYLKEEGRFPLLDTGCGNGELLNLLSGFGPLYGCDIELGHVIVARQRTELDIRLCDYGTEDVFSGIQFGTITAINWLHNNWKVHHAIDCEKLTTDKPFLPKVLKALDRDIKPEGIFCFDWPNETKAKLESWLQMLYDADWNAINILGKSIYVMSKIPL